MYHAGDGSSLGRFSRTRREPLSPAAAGLPPGRRRRTPGLRREELAQLCGVSPTWIAWLEQGRVKSISVPTMIALASALKLSRAERAERVVAELRADSARWRGDPVTDALVAEPCERSPEFEGYWRQQKVLRRDAWVVRSRNWQYHSWTTGRGMPRRDR